MGKKNPGSVADGSRHFPVIALKNTRAVTSAILLVFGLGFVAVFVASLLNLTHLQPILFFREISDPVKDAIIGVLPFSHPIVSSIIPFFLGIGLLLLRQLLDGILIMLVDRITPHAPPTPARIFSIRPAPTPASPTRNVAEEQSFREKILKNFATPGRKDLLKFVVAAPDSERRREELLKSYWEIEHALKAALKKDCTFLSADVVGSTRMKLGQNDAEVKASFHAYEEMLKLIFLDFGAWKQAWTPDGVMICFLTRELAIGAAKRILENLEQFNRNFNKLPTPFSVRCGINGGEVAIYEDSQLEHVADRVIDVAGHMQKEAPANSLLLGAHVLDKIKDKSGFIPYAVEVDGYAAYEWRVR